MIAASVKSIMESTEKLCGEKVKLKVIRVLFLMEVVNQGLHCMYSVGLFWKRLVLSENRDFTDRYI